MTLLVKECLKNSNISSLLGILQLTDEHAYNHSINVAELVEEYINLSKEENSLAWTEEECVEIIKGALLHDIGKTFLPFGLQSSSIKLDDLEMDILKMHPLLGRVAIKNSHFSEIIENIIYYHHANADGSGYPRVKGKMLTIENVPDYVWVIVYADRFEAMTSYRPFQTPKSYPEAWEQILDMTRNNILPYQYLRIFGEIVKKRSIFQIT